MEDVTPEALEPTIRIELPRERIAEFCRRWEITELALFGSVLRDDFRPDSDVDVLVTFAPGTRTTLFDLVDIRDELSELFGRPADVQSRRGVERGHNAHRKRSILDSATVLYASR